MLNKHNKLKNRVMVIKGLPPQRKDALKKGSKINFENESGIVSATVLNDCRSDENGECRACVKIDRFEIYETNIVSRCD